MKLTRSFAKVTAVVSALVLAFVPAAQAANQTLVVGGASSVSSILGKCKNAYTAATNDSFAYASSSSGTGQRDMESGKNDISFSDSAHTTSQSGTPINASEIHVPTFVWPVGIMHKKFSNKTVIISAKNASLIFAGKITKWNDPLLQADNKREITRQIFQLDANGEPVKKDGKPVVLRTVKQKVNLTLPNKPITVIYRGDSSGTTGNLLAAFGKIDPANWPTASADGNSRVFSTSDALAAVKASPIRFQAANTSAGVAVLAAKVPYSITYAEVNFADLNGLGVADIINPNGDTVSPSDSAVGLLVAESTIAANGVVTLDYASKKPGVYPFSVVTYALALTDYKNATKGAAVKEALEWHAFNCPVTAPDAGFIKIEKTSPLGKVISTQLAKLGK
jgi:phosphate transport system substrate-binding protein